MEAEKKKKYKILIVEDDSSLLEGYNIALAMEDFLTFTARDGMEGLQVAAAQKPDLILLDIMMPVLDGIEMLQELRKRDDYGKKVPVVLLTNLTSNKEEIVKKIADPGQLYYIIKADFTFRQVVEKIKEILTGKI